MISSGENSLPLKRGGPIVLFLVLVLAGLAGNYYSFELFFNIQFTFGSIFALLALQFFGLWPGVLAGAIISTMTFVLWNHPYAIIIMTAEVLVVGAMTGRRKIDLVLADMLYWLVLGIPLVLLFYYGIMDVALYNAYALMMKQAVNGIVNVVAARLVYMGVIQRSRAVLFPLREVFFDLLAAAVLILSLFIVVREGRGDLREADSSIRGSLVQARARMAETLEQTVRSRFSTIVYLAGIAEHRPPSSLQESLEQAHAMNSDFLRIGLQDREGIVTAFSPRRDEYGRPHIGKSYADRPFIPQLKRDRKPMLSDVEISRFGAPRPRVGVIAPVIANRRYEGFVFGALDLARLQAPLELAARGELVQGLRFTLVDEHERVIVTSRADLNVMDVLRRPAGELRRQDDGISQWIPLGRKNAPPADRWKDSLYITGSSIGEGAPWRLVLELPIAPLQKRLAEKYTAYLTDIFGLLTAMLIAGRFLSRGATNSLERIADLSSHIPAAVASGERIDWPSSSIAETDRLIANLRDMSQVIAIQFYKIRLMNEDLERMISERTGELRESRERFRALIESASDWIWEVDADGRYTYASPRIRDLLGYEPQEIIGKTPFDLMAPGEAQRVFADFMARIRDRQPIVRLENVNLHRDGRVVILETSGVPIIDADGRFRGYRGIDRDITVRRQAEEKFRQLATEQQTILKTIPIGIAFSQSRVLVWTNPAFARIFGYSLEEAQGMAARALYAHAEDYERVGRDGYALIREGAVYMAELPAARKDGSTFWMSLTGTAVNPDDIGQGTIWMMQDITARKRAEFELQKKTRELEDLTRDLEQRVQEETASRLKGEQLLFQQSKMAAMGEMLGAIAHQWRQPLTGLGLIIQNLPDALAYGELDRQYLGGAVEKAMAQIRRMSKTIDDFRTFFRPDKERTRFDTMVVVGDVLSLYSAELAASSVDFRLTCRTHCRTFTRVEDIVPCSGKTVSGYRNEFEHVVMNLVSNAREAVVERRESGRMGRDERGSIAIDFQQADGTVLIEVADNGGGVREDIIDRIFEPYFTTKDPARGTGLGLYMSKVIIEEHMQGKLSARNSADGAVICIELPAA